MPASGGLISKRVRNASNGWPSCSITPSTASRDRSGFSCSGDGRIGAPAGRTARKRVTMRWPRAAGKKTARSCQRRAICPAPALDGGRSRRRAPTPARSSGRREAARSAPRPAGRVFDRSPQSPHPVASIDEAASGQSWRSKRSARSWPLRVTRPTARGSTPSRRCRARACRALGSQSRQAGRARARRARPPARPAPQLQISSGRKVSAQSIIHALARRAEKEEQPGRGRRAAMSRSARNRRWRRRDASRELVRRRLRDRDRGPGSAARQRRALRLGGGEEPLALGAGQQPAGPSWRKARCSSGQSGCTGALRGGLALGEAARTAREPPSRAAVSQDGQPGARGGTAARLQGGCHILAARCPRMPGRKNEPIRDLARRRHGPGIRAADQEGVPPGPERHAAISTSSWPTPPARSAARSGRTARRCAANSRPPVSSPFAAQVQTYREQLQLSGRRVPRGDRRRPQYGFDEALLVPSTREDIDDLWTPPRARLLDDQVDPAGAAPPGRRRPWRSTARPCASTRPRRPSTTPTAAACSSTWSRCSSWRRGSATTTASSTATCSSLGVLFHDLGKLAGAGRDAGQRLHPGRPAGRPRGDRARPAARRAAPRSRTSPPTCSSCSSTWCCRTRESASSASPVEPMTAEAMALHFIDDLDSKLHQLRALARPGRRCSTAAAWAATSTSARRRRRSTTGRSPRAWSHRNFSPGAAAQAGRRRALRPAARDGRRYDR